MGQVIIGAEMPVIQIIAPGVEVEVALPGAGQPFLLQVDGTVNLALPGTGLAVPVNPIAVPLMLLHGVLLVPAKLHQAAVESTLIGIPVPVLAEKS